MLLELPELPFEISDATTWQVSGAGKLHWRCWEGEYVVFNPLSGDTHLLDIVAGGVLMDILDGPSTAGELVGRAGAFLDVEGGEALSSYVKDILQKLDELGLIEPISEC